MTEASDYEGPQDKTAFVQYFRSISEGILGNGVIDPGDMAVTALADGSGVEVAPGTAWYGQSRYTISTAQSLAVSGGDSTYDRWDTVVYDTANDTPTVREGTAESRPTPPEPGADDLPLAFIYVPAGSGVLSDNVLNWRSIASSAENITAEIVETAADRTISSERYTLVDTSAGSFTVTLPSPADGRAVSVVDSAGNASNNPITIDPGTATLSGSDGTISTDGAGLTLRAYSGTWYVVSGSGTGSGGSASTSTTTISSDYTTGGEDLIFVETADATGDVTVMLSSNDVVPGNEIGIVDIQGNASTNAIIINTEGTETVNGQSSVTVDIDRGSIELASDGTNWSERARNLDQWDEAADGTLSGPSLSATNDVSAASASITNAITGSSIDVDTLIGADVANASSDEVPIAQGDGTLSMGVVSGGTAISTTTISGDYTTSDDDFIFVNTADATADVTITLASADATTANEITIIDIQGNATTNAIVIQTEGTETVNGGSSVTVDIDYGSITVSSDGTNWFEPNRDLSQWSEASDGTLSGAALSASGAISGDSASITNAITGSSIDVNTLIGADVANASSDEVPIAQGDGTLSMGVISGGTAISTTTISSDYTTSDDDFIYVQTADAAGDVTVTLASADAANGNDISIIDVQGNASTNAIIINTESSETINGSSSVTVDIDRGSIEVVSDGTNWSERARNLDQWGEAADGTLSGPSVSASGDVAGDTATISNGISGGSATLSGSVSADSASITNAITGSSIDVDTLIGADVLNSAADEVPVAQGDGTLAMQLAVSEISDDGASVLENASELNFRDLLDATANASTVDISVDATAIFQGDLTGNVASSDQSVVAFDGVPDDEKVEIQKCGLTTDTIQAVPSGVDLVLGTASGGSFSSDTTLISGDGSTVSDRVEGDPVASINPDGESSVVVYIDNTTASSVSVTSHVEGVIVSAGGDERLAQMLMRQGKTTTVYEFEDYAGLSGRDAQYYERRQRSKELRNRDQ